MSCCKNCGGLLAEDDLFCPTCGEQRGKPGAGQTRRFLKLCLILVPILLLMSALWYFGFNPCHGRNARGNTTGNIVNFGLAAQQGDWIYYLSGDEDDREICKVRTDGSDRTGVGDDSAWDLNVIGDWIYYSNEDDGERIYKIRTDGSGRTRVNDDRSWWVTVIGVWISNVDSDDYRIYDRIYKIRTDGNERTRVNDN